MCPSHFWTICITIFKFIFLCYSLEILYGLHLILFVVHQIFMTWYSIILTSFFHSISDEFVAFWYFDFFISFLSLGIPIFKAICSYHLWIICITVLKFISFSSIFVIWSAHFAYLFALSLIRYINDDLLLYKISLDCSEVDDILFHLYLVHVRFAGR